MVNYVFEKNQNTTTTKPKKQTQTTLALSGTPGTSRAAVWSVTSRPLRQLNVSIEVKFFNCYNVMERHTNKQIKPKLKATPV